MSTKKLQIIGSLGGSVEVDATLTHEGKAADAKATGDAIKEVSMLIGDKPVSEQINDAKPLETTPEDIIEWMSAENIITPVASSSGQVYLTNDNKILIL
jgi:hypothetical protein